MLKKSFILLFMLYHFFSEAQDKKHVQYIRKDNFGSVYITTDTTLNAYEYLVTPALKGQRLQWYNDGIAEVLNDTIINFKKHNVSETILANWCPLYVLKDKFYVYSPSDWINHYSYSVSDSTLVENTFEGSVPMLMSDYTERSSSEFVINLANKEPSSLRIKTIDASRGIALWAFTYRDTVEYTFMVKEQFVKKFPLVVCECGGMKCYLEYKFETIDEKYLRRRGWL